MRPRPRLLLRRHGSGSLPALCAVLIGLGGSHVAFAADCADEVEHMARQYNLTVDIPVVPPEGEAAPLPVPDDTTDTLAEGDGIIAPPADEGVPMAIEPPPVDEGMATAPEIIPDLPEPETHALTAAQRAQVETLLMAANSAAEAGDTEQCFERLQEARDIATEAAPAG